MDIHEIPGFGGNYGITKSGEVYRVKKHNSSKETPLRASLVSGYPRVSLCVNGKVKNVNVHKLMALTFLDLSEGLVVNHINGDKLDCRLENLEVCTHAYNEWHKREVLGKRSAPLAKISESEVIKIRRMKESGLSLSQIAKLMGITKGNVSFIVNRKTWRHVA